MNSPSPFPPDQSIHCFTVQDMSCEHCQARVEGAARSVEGAREARVDLTAGMLTVRGGDPQAILRAVEEAGYPIEQIDAPRPGCPLAETVSSPAVSQPPSAADRYLLRVDDMHCASCVARVEQAILAVAGVREAAVNLVDRSASVVGGDPIKVVEAVNQAGYGTSLLEEQGHTSAGDRYEIDILGMHCASCVARVEQAILALPGVTGAVVNLIEKKAQVQGGDPEQVVRAIVDQGYGASLRHQTTADTFFLTLQPQPDADELAQVREILLALDPATEMSVDNGRLRVSTSQHPADVLLRLTDIGYQVTLEESFTDPAISQAEETWQEIRRSWRRALLAGLMGFGLMAGHMSGLFPHLHEGRLFWAGAALLCLCTMLYSGRNYFIGAWKQARHGAANMDTLVALGTGAAWLSSVLVIADPHFIPGAADYLYLDAAVMILAFLQLGHVLETKAKRTTSEAIGALVGLRARTAWVIRASGQVEIPVSLLRLGDRVRVKPGEKVPIDGEIVEGRTTIDESMLTGEPLAVAREIGDPVTGGTINRSGAFILRVTRLGDDTTLARIIRMVHTAQMSKPPIGRLVDRIAGVFVPVVITISLVSFFAWWSFAQELALAHGLTAAIAVLVIACPCALGLATPIAIMVGTSRAAQCNVLIRNSDALQTASTLTHVVVDKTGTLTQGKPAVTAIMPVAGMRQDEVLLWAASLESGSEHPLAEAVLSAQLERGEPLRTLDNFTAIPGRGVQAEHAGVRYLLGNHLFLDEQGLALPAGLRTEAEHQAARGGTPVWLARGTEVMGLLILKDPVRPDSAAAVAALQRQGITVVMCSGDNRATAEAVAREVGITEVHSEILPEQKLEVIQALQQQGCKVGMVGDGVNDAPALAQADTGFALGSGTDVAIENADITLTGDSLLLVADAIAISTATIRNIRQNLFGAFIYNVIGIPLAAGLFYPLTGWQLEPMFASAAMALSSVTVVTNANRLRFFRPR
ncbi:copper-translocating P-type ATPase [Desulfobulbus propionicus DSM 2032]|uniref:Copper-exporting P-type ATPase n=1 Tax=Desulfobulbus propionicus (strain ATCC 33891 / DSM 2032 / VKM B-1956 / 1pr3) TaxID=577650 RepID=A0A7U3YP55_DESPD|nr:heavy metal translocating P-type ATPase [Desulfobulbus propionicus]ADW18833.1 copper-translocating P-type ATPase [Desulfobulbus propionicus DSM 2032]